MNRESLKAYHAKKHDKKQLFNNFNEMKLDFITDPPIQSHHLDELPMSNYRKHNRINVRNELKKHKTGEKISDEAKLELINSYYYRDNMFEKDIKRLRHNINHS